MQIRYFLAFLVLSLASVLSAQTSESGKVVGRVVDPTTQHPIEYAAVALKNASGQAVYRTATDAKGAFAVENVAAGEYRAAYGLVGSEAQESARFRLDAQHREVDLGTLTVGSDTVTMQRVEVASRKEAFYNSIDRKVYNVGKDIHSVTGSASDLLQNVPSVQVDIEGNVSLRGDGNVLILVNGKTSAMMGKNRAAVLEQMPADGIEKIEVITNPSAKYKPDGTAGIINITLKRKQEAGYSGSVRAAVGNDRRYNASVTANFNPGKYNLYGTAAIRQDDRPRSVRDERAHLDTATNSFVSTEQITAETARPRSRIGQAGIDYTVDEHTKAGASVNYNYRDFLRHSTVRNTSRDGAGVVTGDYDRLRLDPEFEKDLEATGAFQHSFDQEDRELSLEIRRGRTTEQEDNHYSNVYRAPSRVPTYDATLITATETNTEATADYAHPISAEAKFETGYSGQWNTVDMDFRGSFLDPATATWVIDASRTNRFIYDAKIHAVYGTYAQKLGDFGFLAGARFERGIL